MSLRTATAISLTGIAACTIISLFFFFFQIIMIRQMHDPIPFWMNEAFGFLHIALFNGSIMLFLAVLYSKQKE